MTCDFTRFCVDEWNLRSRSVSSKMVERSAVRQPKRAQGRQQQLTTGGKAKQGPSLAAEAERQNQDSAKTGFTSSSSSSSCFGSDLQFLIDYDGVHSKSSEVPRLDRFEPNTTSFQL
ncbi:hypothetical protein Pyn_08519 [Prunus yedoensis var. nudiflora]|uniref:Uncharacterized protein n=1 Tax=Prunus yedoensis var. nudiflora TaxID=2094558 RepID=A0A314Z0H9_PRUYE|nr:hypothetical protein Pyn_08519 [Prunus yedoensis var. nudiflora]